MKFDFTKITAEKASKQLYDHDKKEYEDLADEMGLEGEKKRLFVERSLKSLYDYEV